MSIYNMTVVLNKQRKDADGRYPLRIRWFKDGRVYYKKLGVKLKDNEWDGVKVIKHSNKDLLNVQINTKVSELQAQMLSGEITGKTISKNSEFLKWAEKKLSEMANTDSEGTVKHKKAYLSKFDNFAPGIKFKGITTELLYKYEAHCRTLGNTDNTVWSSIKHLKVFIHEAINDGLMDPKQIAGFKRTKYENPQRKYLNSKQLAAIEKFSNTKDEDAIYATWFLFECYSGLRFSDAARFTHDNIKGNKIIIRTEKSGSDVNIPLHSKLKAILPKLKGTLPANQVYNRALKRVAIKSKIGFVITSHLARHTFAVQWLDNGGSMEVLSKLLGHTRLSTTQIYGKITDKRIEKEVMEVFK